MRGDFEGEYEVSFVCVCMWRGEAILYRAHISEGEKSSNHK